MREMHHRYSGGKQCCSLSDPFSQLGAAGYRKKNLECFMFNNIIWLRNSKLYYVLYTEAFWGETVLFVSLGSDRKLRQPKGCEITLRCHLHPPSPPQSLRGGTCPYPEVRDGGIAEPPSRDGEGYDRY